jgi:hypothetical protein
MLVERVRQHQKTVENDVVEAADSPDSQCGTKPEEILLVTLSGAGQFLNYGCSSMATLSMLVFPVAAKP